MTVLWTGTRGDVLYFSSRCVVTACSVRLASEVRKLKHVRTFLRFAACPDLDAEVAAVQKLVRGFGNRVQCRASAC